MFSTLAEIILKNVYMKKPTIFLPESVYSLHYFSDSYNFRGIWQKKFFKALKQYFKTSMCHETVTFESHFIENEIAATPSHIVSRGGSNMSILAKLFANMPIDLTIYFFVSQCWNSYHIAFTFEYEILKFIISLIKLL